jgi:hypothetical protein
MNWDAIAAVAELAAAIGVILSLLYVAAQMRLNTHEISRTNSRRTYSDHAASLRAIVENDNLSDLMIRGLESRDELNAAEKYRFDVAMGNWLQAVEQAFADYRDGSYPEEFLEVHRNTIPAFLCTPGGASWWNERQVWFSKSFRQEVERLVANPGAEAKLAGAPHINNRRD